MSERQALILGATGGIGGATARRLLDGGWRVRALVRGEPMRLDPRCELVRGDARDAAAVTRAAAGTDVIVHAVNPPGYRDWAGQVLPMLDSTIAAARVTGARVVLPGTVYNYGPDALPLVDEDAPQRPATRKGAIRVELERRLETLAASGAAPVLIVRAGDFFGPGAANNWFAQGLVTPGARPRVVRQPGHRGVGHAWAYLPDVAETIARLLDRADLPALARYHLEGQWDADGRQMVEAIVRVLGDPAVPIRRLPWWQLRLAALVAETPRELMEMRYLWQRPLRLSNARLLATLGEEPRTPLLDAVRATLADLGCV
ncbi:NAD-dependent epimerase/dehydratase family protein [Sphingomonas sp. BK580]|uniref:NAD-dependent epimerase/dehydratase family protein n=1 Tax=Sphingomonas sp. BK580 TaxID=2586972 RepID=UPI0016198C74|nr:NAD-dependent epimerase/dehydratase family protein [Sphingomonas sp. BK580]MBB3695023.1 nucleoside-diphosphate-sugar epimerase [Sphingomonas sp. BK580]